MILKKNNKFKPLYKKFILLKENVQNRKKLFRFKKQKWERLIYNYNKKLKWYKKYKPKDLSQHVVSRYPNRNFSYKKRYKNTLLETKRVQVFYGDLSKSSLKKLTKISLKTQSKLINSVFLQFLESRLDIILYRAKFSYSIRNAQQLILHGKILVNNKLVQIKSYLLKPGDLISINTQYSRLIKENLKNSEVWPLPPKHLIINYKTMQIFFGTFKSSNISLNFFYYFNLEKVLTSHYQH